MSTTASPAPKMQYRFLGKTGLKVSVLAIGGDLSDLGTTIEDEDAFKILGAAYDCGINLFEAAEGHNARSEIIIGKAIKHFAWKRSDLVVATKLYWGAVNGTRPENNSGLSRKHIIEGMKASLERLQLDYVDVVYAHMPDRHTPIEETVRAFDWLINQGKALYWGTCKWTDQEVQAAVSVADRLGLIRPVVECPKYSMLNRSLVEVNHAVSSTSTQGINIIGLTTTDPLHGYVLTDSLERSWAAAARESHADILQDLRSVAARLGCSLKSLALAWVLVNPYVSSISIKAFSVEEVQDAVEALRVLPTLTDKVLGDIEAVLNNKPAAIMMRF